LINRDLSEKKELAPRRKVAKKKNPRDEGRYLFDPFSLLGIQLRRYSSLLATVRPLPGSAFLVSLAGGIVRLKAADSTPG
jgi:hypothetical protein